MNILITGITGQDGKLLAMHLSGQGHHVFGLVRDQRVGMLPFGVELLRGDLTDAASVASAVIAAKPEEIYNLGAYTHAGFSFAEPELVLRTNGMGAVHVFEAALRHAPNARVYQASTSEMFGNNAAEHPLWEGSPMRPVNPYGVAKLYAHHMASIYRAMGLWVSCGILFNHVSPLHGREFLPNKVARAAAHIRAGIADTVKLGNLKATRDWGWAPEYVVGMTHILRNPVPDDFVLATGISVTVRAMAEEIFANAGLRLDDHLVVDEGLYRPVELLHLRGDATRAEQAFGWAPVYTWKEIAKELLNAQASASLTVVK